MLPPTCPKCDDWRQVSFWKTAMYFFCHGCRCLVGDPHYTIPDLSTKETFDIPDKEAAA
jgi:hypothetical protein